MNPILFVKSSYPEYGVVFEAMQKAINQMELNQIYPNGVISFAVKLSRGDTTAINFYKTFL